MDQGTRIFSGALACTSDDALAGPTDLPGWTGRHLVAHVAANAEALLDLAHWASTGEETPMYSSPGQRDADIRAGAQKPPAELRRAAEESASRLAAALDRLTDEQCPGRSAPPGDDRSRRARSRGCAPAKSWSTLSTSTPPLHGSLCAVAAYLTGRPGADVLAPSGPASDLPPWL